MVDLMAMIEEEPKAETLTPQEVAVREQAIIDRLKIQIEEATARRDEALKEAYDAGVRVYSGYRITQSRPADTISETKLATMHPDVFDGFCTWYPSTIKLKVTKTALAKFLKKTANANPDQVLADITEPGKGAPTYRLTVVKEASQ